MTLDEAYRHIKASYIHHSQERNAVFLPQAELIAMECIEKCKQADTQSVRRGYWEEVTDYGGWGDTHYRCSVCGEEWYLEDGKPKDNNMNFCPRCGARMDLGDEKT